jgi:integrase
MARKVRGNELENRTRRLKLPISKKPVFVRVGEGLSVGYRRNLTAGTWVLRIANGQGGATTTAVGHADDFDEADGINFLTFWQAQEKAKLVARKGKDRSKPLTVRDAADTYLTWLQAKNPRTEADTRGRLEKHFLPKFGAKLVSALTKTTLDGWLAGLVVASDDPEKVRRSKDSANRVLTMVKALLNHAIRDAANGIGDDSAWRHVRPFQGVSKPRDIRFTDDEVRRLVASTPDQSTANLLTGAFLTGARYGELIEARVGHFDKRSHTLRVNVGKTGSRTIILQTSASKFLSALAGDRNASDYLFVREDDSRWKRSDQTRPIKEALAQAGLPEEGSIYALRHSYISQAIEGGVPLNIIAENCGTSVRMIEKTYAKILAEKRRNFIEIGAPRL